MQVLSSLPLNPKIRRVSSTMPLIQGYSGKSVAKNIKTGMKKGQAQEQALAGALSAAQKAAKKAKKY